jgi:hypothetical protein
LLDADECASIGFSSDITPRVPPCAHACGSLGQEINASLYFLCVYNKHKGKNAACNSCGAKKRVFDWLVVESCLIGQWLSDASVGATPHHRTGQGRHLHDHGMADEQHWYRARAHSLAS